MALLVFTVIPYFIEPLLPYNEDVPIPRDFHFWESISQGE
jgi:hypothetical protein